MGFECFPLPYRIFQFAGEFIMAVPPNQITIESKPCHVIQSNTVILTPRVDHYHFSRSVFPFSCFTQECPVPLPVCTLPTPSPTSPHIMSYRRQKSSKNNWLCTINLDSSGSGGSHLSGFVTPPGPGVDMCPSSAGGSTSKRR